MLDTRLDKLGVYFEYHKVLERHGISFEEFVHMVDTGAWAEFVK